MKKHNKGMKPRYHVTKTRWRFGDKYFRGAKPFVQYALQQLGKSRSPKRKAVFQKVLSSRAIARQQDGKSVNWRGAANMLVANLPTICIRSTVKGTKPTRVRTMTGREIARKAAGKPIGAQTKGKASRKNPGGVPSQRSLDKGMQ